MSVHAHSVKHFTVLPWIWLRRLPQLDVENPFVGVGQLTECGARQINMLRSCGAPCTWVDDTNEDTFLRLIANWRAIISWYTYTGCRGNTYVLWIWNILDEWSNPVKSARQRRIRPSKGVNADFWNWFWSHTVGAHLPTGQQLGFSKSWPVYLKTGRF